MNGPAIAENPSKQPSAAQTVYEYVSSTVFALAVVLLVFTFVLRTATVVGISMMNTLHDGDRLILSTTHDTPRQGDIVVLSTKAVREAIVKRVIATAGQTVNIDFQAHKVYVNGKTLSEPYIREPTSERGDVTFPVTVPPGHVFVMGDNRNDSYDSRFSAVGMIDERDIIGRAVFRLLPIFKIGPLAR